jgi:hypothetical protein
MFSTSSASDQPIRSPPFAVWASEGRRASQPREAITPCNVAKPSRTAAISADFPCEMKRLAVLDTEMAYVDAGDPISFLDCNPTSSYMWRNIIPGGLPFGHVPAPDLTGMGQSGRSPHNAYQFINASQGQGTAGAAREHRRQSPNHLEVTVEAKHDVPEDRLHELGAALAGLLERLKRRP